MTLVQALLAGTGLLLVGLSIPLARRRVKPNGWYGLRVEATFADDWVWYEANAFSGRDLLALGAIVTPLVIALPLLGTSEMTSTTAGIAVLLAGAVALAIRGVRRANALLAMRRAQGRGLTCRWLSKSISFEGLLAPVFEPFDRDVLEEWRWLVPHQTARPFAVTAFGDAFLIAGSGAVLFLDTIGGKCEQVASSMQELEQKLQDPKLVEEWFMPGFLDALREAGVTLPQEHCYSTRQSIRLGGKYEVDNFTPTPWAVHFAHAALLHEQVRDLPPGTQITKIDFPRL